jgi:hypothetical protein
MNGSVDEEGGFVEDLDPAVIQDRTMVIYSE